MKKKFSLVIITILALSLIGCAKKNPTNSNQAPVISSLKAEPSSIKVGESSILTATAYDLNGDNLTYQWSAVTGYFVGSGSQVKYAVPGSCCLSSDEITLMVKDSQGQESKKSIKIQISI